ncbi:hypothetical protein T484DRAFT_1824574 [Baffinella frigidus]|nr:hypothetical protein T484DRAFT_1824574 [Cryptophyta sp. CCMP2293]
MASLDETRSLILLENCNVVSLDETRSLILLENCNVVSLDETRSLVASVDNATGTTAQWKEDLLP